MTLSFWMVIFFRIANPDESDRFHQSSTTAVGIRWKLSMLQSDGTDCLDCGHHLSLKRCSLLENICTKWTFTEKYQNFSNAQWLVVFAESYLRDKWKKKIITDFVQQIESRMCITWLASVWVSGELREIPECVSIHQVLEAHPTWKYSNHMYFTQLAQTNYLQRHNYSLATATLLHRRSLIFSRKCQL